MAEYHLSGLDASDPLGFLAALGALRVASQIDSSASLCWSHQAAWLAVLNCDGTSDLLDILEQDLERWRGGHKAIEFAAGADRKEQDLKHSPEAFRTLMRELAANPEAAAFVAAYATGIIVDGSGQTKPTSLHFTAGQQRFMDAVLDLRSQVTREDLEEALYGPWVGRVGPKDLRWRAGSERSRALLSFDPSSTKSAVLPGASWLAFQAMPFFPAVPGRNRVITTGFTGRGKREQFTWPVWSDPLTAAELRSVLGLAGLASMSTRDREARGIVRVFRSDVVRSSQGYGNFSAAQPV